VGMENPNVPSAFPTSAVHKAVYQDSCIR